MSIDLKQMTLADLMTRDVVTVDRDTTLQEAMGKMVSHGIRHLPVLHGRRVVAVISDRNIRMMVTDKMDPEERRRYMDSTPVMNHASSPVTTAREDTPVPEAARIFVESRIGCLPIVDDQEGLTGIVTQVDLLKQVARLDE